MLNEGGTASVSACAFTGNTAGSTGGGGIAVYGGALTIVNSTIAANTTAAQGGGLLVLNGSSVTAYDDTIAENAAADGGGIDEVSGTVTIGNTIVAQDTASGSGPDALGTFASQGNNLIGATDGSGGWVASDLTGMAAEPLNPLLAPLANYGGPTETLALLPGSPAIDAGNNGLVPSDVTTDQRGFARIVNGVVDIGSFESSGFTITIVSGDDQSTDLNTAFGSPLVVEVTSSFGEPVAGGIVTFTAPSTGASTSPAVVTAPIDDSGDASVTETANGESGSYTVVAWATGVTSPADFALTNNGHSGSGDIIVAIEADDLWSPAEIAATRAEATGPIPTRPPRRIEGRCRLHPPPRTQPWRPRRRRSLRPSLLPPRSHRPAIRSAGTQRWWTRPWAAGTRIRKITENVSR